MPKHSNLSVFLPHVGCPHRCSFCDQRAISETTRVPSPAEVGDALRRAARQLKNPPEDCEAAFFGGSFTALEPAYQEALLREARAVVTEYHLKGIRLSTRPDAVDDAVCQRLLSFGVTSVELGAQSMDDGVLLQNGRGHTAAQVEQAAAAVHRAGLELGLQMMVGLWGDTPQTLRQTAARLAALHPATLRIYPVVVLPHTELARRLQDGSYRPMPLEEGVSLCAELLWFFRERNIRVIRLGLHDSQTVAACHLGGLYHPAFGELCENVLYFRRMEPLVTEADAHQTVLLWVPKGAVSKAAGQHRSNLRQLEERYHCRIRLREDAALAPYELRRGGMPINEVTEVPLGTERSGHSGL